MFVALSWIQSIHVSYICGGPELDAVLQLWAWAEEEDHFPQFSWSCSPGYCFLPLAHPCLASLWSASCPPISWGPSVQICLPAGWSPVCTEPLVFLPKYRTLHFCDNPACSVLQPNWMAAQPPGPSDIPTGFGLKSTMHWIWFIQWLSSIQSL